MLECDICGKKTGIIHELGKPRPPFYDTLKICEECWNERRKQNERSDRTGKREKKTHSKYE